MSVIDLLDDDEAPQGPIGALVLGKVSNVDDPDRLGRVKVRFPTLSGVVESHWARPLGPAAGVAAGGVPHGVYWPFELGDEVVVGFVDNHPECPVVLGGLWSKKRPPPAPDASRRAHRVLQSASGHVLRLDDTRDAEKLEIVAAGAENAITLSTADGTVTIQAGKCLEIKVGADITLTLKDGKVSLACKALSIAQCDDVAIAGKSVAVEAEQGLVLTGGQGVNINNGALEVS